MKLALSFLLVLLSCQAAAATQLLLMDSSTPKQPLRLRGGEQAKDTSVFAFLHPLFPDVANLVPTSVFSLFDGAPITPTQGAKTAKPMPVRSSRASKVTTAKAEKVPVDTVEATIIVDATPQEVFAVATNFEDYPKWAGGCQTAKILEDGPDAPKLVQFYMGIFGLSMANTMQYKYEKPYKMTWWVTEGGVKDLLGIYEFKPLADGRTHVTYKLRVDPGFPIPKMIRTTASRTIASSALKELKRHTEKLKQSAAQPESAQATEESPTAALRNLIALC